MMSRSGRSGTERLLPLTGPLPSFSLVKNIATPSPPLCELSFLLVDDERRLAFGDHVVVDDHFFDAASRRNLVHDVEHRVLEDGPQASSARLADERFLGHGLKRALRELELDTVHLEELLVLLDER